LLQFLALYQVLEVYFPAAASREAARRVRSILKEPDFRSDKDSDIARLVGIIRQNRVGGMGSEREQLKATILECVSAEELRDYINADDRRIEFFKKKHTGLTTQKIPLDQHSDPRDAASIAIYDIRCKVVHSKGDAGMENAGRILPFSREADQLGEYVGLLNFLARKALITSSARMSL
jgi:hypothetical protein